MRDVLRGQLLSLRAVSRETLYMTSDRECCLVMDME